MRRISYTDLQVGKEYVAIRVNLPRFATMISTEDEPTIRIRFTLTEVLSPDTCYVQVLESDIKDTCSATNRILKSLRYKEPIRIKLGLPMYSLYEITRGIRRGKINMVKRKRI